MGQVISGKRRNAQKIFWIFLFFSLRVWAQVKSETVVLPTESMDLNDVIHRTININFLFWTGMKDASSICLSKTWQKEVYKLSRKADLLQIFNFIVLILFVLIYASFRSYFHILFHVLYHIIFFIVILLTQLQSVQLVKLLGQSTCVCDETPFPSSFFLLQGSSPYSNRVNRKIRENDCIVCANLHIISSWCLFFLQSKHLSCYRLSKIYSDFSLSFIDILPL